MSLFCQNINFNLLLEISHQWNTYSFISFWILLNGRFNMYSCVGVRDDKNNGYYVEFCGVGYDKHNGDFTKFDQMHGSRKRYSCMLKSF